MKPDVRVKLWFAVASLCFGNSNAADQHISGCNTRLAGEDFEYVLKQTTSIDQQKLIKAIQANDEDGALDLISHVRPVDFRFPNGATLLSVAVENANPRILKAMLEAGADPNIKDCSGLPALSFVENNLHPQSSIEDQNLIAIADLLVLHGASIEGKSNQYWRSQLFWLAAKNGHVTFTTWLLAHGVRVNEAFNGASALSAAINDDRVAEVAALLDGGARVNPTDNGSATPLIEAVQKGDPELVRLLVDHGADVNVKGVWGSPLGNAINRGGPTPDARNASIIDLLTAAGAKR